VSPPPCLRVSLDHLDELLQLRLTNLTAQSRWQPRYQRYGNLQDLLRSADFFGENSCT
ncbi:unnamed protein product, partial [Lampetra fluviatilis]